MSKSNKSFNDKMMMLVGVPVVLCWMGFACMVIWFGLHDDKVLNNIDGYTTLIAIIGGPALLILTSILELWKSEQNQEITSMPDVWAAKVGQDKLQGAHERRLATERQKVELGLLKGEGEE